MTDMCEPMVEDAGPQTARIPSEEQGPDGKLGPDKEHGPGEEHGPGAETAEQRRQRRLLRELALRALI